ncbi:hypothetical protein AsAng_0026600 [Aureispira anguillae]|uniref:Uncharacterized protein n=1 Tax=Aureispira anguillae TaxID=2864201 RepID=A0A915YF22_9BACT|nr:hypothetical protein AsAng_0026600 [Aureispira anguillae]
MSPDKVHEKIFLGRTDGDYHKRGEYVVMFELVDY